MSLKRKRAPLVGLLPFAAPGAATTAVDLSPCHRFLAVADAAGRVRVRPFRSGGGGGGGANDSNGSKNAKKSDDAKNSEDFILLEAAAGLHITWCEFSPDCARLAAATSAGRGFVWQRRISSNSSKPTSAAVVVPKVIIYPILSNRYSMKNRNEISHYVSVGSEPNEKIESRYKKYKPIIKRINIDLENENENDDEDDSS